MPAGIASIPPSTLKGILERYGWQLLDETSNVWLYEDPADPKAEPLPIPKHGDEVDTEIMDWVAHHHGLQPAIMDAVRRHVAPSTPPPPPSSPPPP